jgi:hypothetical protein
MRIALVATSLLATASAIALAQPEADPRTPVSTITGAQWTDYASMYPRSPLCAEEEVTLWSCVASRGRAHALCSSKTVTRDTGYFQYRASRKGRLVFSYPESRSPPRGRFTYYSGMSGDASLDFANAGYQYSLVDPLRGRASILVTSPGGRSTEIACDHGGATLQLNYTLRLMYDSGVWSDP